MRLRWILVLVAVGVAIDKSDWTPPPAWIPWAPLAIGDPVTPLTSFKLARLKGNPEACRATLASAPDLRFTALADTTVAGCPLSNIVRVTRSGVTFSSSYLASCPLAVAWALFERHGLEPAAQEELGASVERVDHLGSFACRNIYGRANARRSEHASAEALDVAGFVLDDGRRITLRQDWGEGAEGVFLKRVQRSACDVFGTTLGPDYNAAHADHFHLGVGTGLGVGGICR